MTRDQVASRIAADPQRPWLSVAKGWRSGLLIACVSVGVAATLRALLQNIGHFHYLPLLPAVMVVALMADRRAAAVAVALCVAADLVLTRSEQADAIVQAVVFVVVAAVVAELCRRFAEAVEALRDARDAVDLVQSPREQGPKDQPHGVWRLNAMGEMAATLAHELNQPLSAAAVYLHAGRRDAALAGPMGDSVTRSLDLAKTQILRAGDIIRHMRERISTGDHAIRPERASSLVEEMAPVFAMIGRDAGVTIRFDIDGEDDHVMADRIQIQQAVSNLVRNAVDAVNGRAEPLVLIVGRRIGPEAYEFRVEDNGPGISQDRIDQIFRPMATSKTGGMGLGLSVTRSIVESHGATLKIDRSTLGGAVFAFRLPRVTEAETAC